jgi:hypothetical protein
MSDIVFNPSEQVTVQCDNLLVQGHDLLLDSAARRRGGGRGFRRALVHDQSDGLTINFNSDYPGGVTIHDVRMLDVVGDLQFRIFHQDEVLAHDALAVLGGGTARPNETVKLGEVIKALRSEIAELRAQIANLAQRP